MPSLAENLGLVPDPAPARCSFVRKNGRQCERNATEFETVCVVHGASIARTQDSMYRRILALQEKSIVVLEELLDNAFEDKVKLAAAQTILDRTNLGPKSTINVTVEDLTHATQEEMLERATRLRERLLQTQHDAPYVRIDGKNMTPQGAIN